MPPLIRDATVADLDALNAIYNHYVAHSTCTFQEIPATPAERLAWWHEHEGRFPVLAVCAGPELAGWASLSRYSDRCGYRFTVETSIYLKPETHGRGWGKLLLKALLERGRLLGCRGVIAKICAEQTPSLRLHAALGFREVGRLHEVGYKFGRWLDVVLMQYGFQEGAARGV